MPWKNAGYRVMGIDISREGFGDNNWKEEDYLWTTIEKTYPEIPQLILINPPFAVSKELEEYESTRRYLSTNGWTQSSTPPEVFLEKTISLFGKKMPIVLFAPCGFRLNLNEKSKRFQRFANRTYPEIKSIISLPWDIYKENNVYFHSEILIFNVKGLKPHYFPSSNITLLEISDSNSKSKSP